MSDSLTSGALNALSLPVVFTPDAWQRAVLLNGSSHPEKLQIDRLSNVLRAAFRAHLAHPNAPFVVFEVATIDPTSRADQDRVPGSGVTEPTEGALWAKEDGHRGSWLTLSLRRPNTHQRNHDDQAHYRIDRVG